LPAGARGLVGIAGHLEGWARDVADLRVHGTTGEVPIERTGWEIVQHFLSQQK
jgi:hypothetical protein